MHMEQLPSAMYASPVYCSAKNSFSYCCQILVFLISQGVIYPSSDIRWIKLVVFILSYGLIHPVKNSIAETVMRKCCFIVFFEGEFRVIFLNNHTGEFTNSSQFM